MTTGQLIDEVCSAITTTRCYTQTAPRKLRITEGDDRTILECLLVHTDCGSSCSQAVVVEAWTLERRLRSPDIEGLSSIFLLNAIRSHLHYSQFTAWLCKNTLPTNISCDFRIRTKDRALSSLRGFHEFPLCKLNRSHLLSVSVEYLTKDAIRPPSGICLPSNLSSDQWLLPSPTSSPENSVEAHEMNNELKGLKHKLTSESSTEEPKNKILATEKAIITRLSNKVEEKSVETLTIALNTLVARGRQRTKSGSMIVFNRTTGLPSHSSPAPLSRQRNSFSTSDVADLRRPHGLLGSFEESALKDRLNAVKQLDGYKLQITASGSFSPPHVSLEMKVHVFDENEHDPLPCLGTCSLSSLGNKGYRIPRHGMLQATLFNPQGTVVKVFLVSYDVSDMPPSSHTFLRQRYFLEAGRDKHLQYLIHFRLASDRSNRVFLHTDVRVLFSQNSSLSGINIQLKGNVGVDCGKYQLMSEVQTPVCPKYSPKK